MSVDGLHSTRPIEFVVHSPSDARGMFDLLTYEKGGSVLRMLEQHLGEDTFRDGIRRYLTTHAYGNTVTQDLWDALTSVSGQAVGEIMDTWILQGGHPLVSVDDGIVTQSPFSYGPADGESAIGSTWQVPLLTRHIAGGDITATLLGKDPVVLGDGAGSVVANAGGSGVYRVAYAPADAAVGHPPAHGVRVGQPAEEFRHLRIALRGHHEVPVVRHEAPSQQRQVAAQHQSACHQT